MGASVHGVSALQETVQLLLELRDILELPVYACEAYIRHLIQILQRGRVYLPLQVPHRYQ